MRDGTLASNPQTLDDYQKICDHCRAKQHTFFTSAYTLPNGSEGARSSTIQSQEYRNIDTLYEKRRQQLANNRSMPDHHMNTALNYFGLTGDNLSKAKTLKAHDPKHAPHFIDKGSKEHANAMVHLEVVNSIRDGTLASNPQTPMDYRIYHQHCQDKAKKLATATLAAKDDAMLKEYRRCAESYLADAKKLEDAERRRLAYSNHREILPSGHPMKRY